MTRTQPAVIATGKLVRLREKQIEDAQQDYDWRRDPELATYDAAVPISMSFRSFVATFADVANNIAEGTEFGFRNGNEVDQ